MVFRAKRKYITSLYTGIPEQKLLIPTSVGNPHDSFTLYTLEIFFRRILAYAHLKKVIDKGDYYPAFLFVG
ncbi:MAG: hypothetical protein ABIL27_03985 [candidate division WOR-3 bacterium]